MEPEIKVELYNGYEEKILYNYDFEVIFLQGIDQTIILNLPLCKRQGEVELIFHWFVLTLLTG